MELSLVWSDGAPVRICANTLGECLVALVAYLRESALAPEAERECLLSVTITTPVPAPVALPPNPRG